MRRIAIIGGGASGLAAAIAAAEAGRVLNGGRHEALEVVVFERDDRVGRPVLATGNGRCNFSNACPDPVAYRNAPFVCEAFASLELSRPASGPLLSGRAPNAVLAFFEGLGLAWREESAGRLYPQANKASSVLDVLRARASALGVQEACGKEAVRIDAPDEPGGRWHLRLAGGEVRHAQALVVASGGKKAGALLGDFCDCLAAQPVLGPLATDGPVKSLDNIRVKCRVGLVGRDGREKGSEAGELLFRKYGVSGIAVFNLSRLAEPGDVLSIDMAPQLDGEACKRELARRAEGLKRVGTVPAAQAVLRGMVLPLVADAVAERVGLGDGTVVEGDVLDALVSGLKSFELRVRGIGDAKLCQASRGGAAVEGLVPSTMGVRRAPGLFVCGEAVDVDGPCGGYNLHWAWASGLLAGMASAATALGQMS